MSLTLSTSLGRKALSALLAMSLLLVVACSGGSGGSEDEDTVDAIGIDWSEAVTPETVKPDTMNPEATDMDPGDAEGTEPGDIAPEAELPGEIDVTPETLPDAEVDLSETDAPDLLPDTEVLPEIDPGEGLVETDSAEVVLVGPAPGEKGAMLITEFMAKSQMGDDEGEWIELYNNSAETLDLGGCLLHDDANDSHTIEGSLGVAAGDYLVLAKSGDPDANHGLNPDYVYASFNLKNGSDAIVLVCAGLEIDRVVYTSDWYDDARATQLDPAPESMDPDVNDEAQAWCLAVTPYGSADMQGTPGAVNTTCVIPTVDWCRLQFPLAMDLGVDEVVTTYGRVFVTDVTGLSSGVDAIDTLVAQAGYGPDGSWPDADAAAWTWIDASANAGWIDTEEPGNDEYQADVSFSAIGDYDLAYRFSLDGGSSWVYCDGPAGLGADGSEDGYDPANAGALLVRTTSCDPNPCLTPPIDFCLEDGVSLISYTPPGDCTVQDGFAVCSYTSDKSNCSLDDKVCVNGECVVEGQGTVPAYAGDLIITEFMARAQSGSDMGEWFELYNNTSGALELGGCVIADDDAESHEIAGSLIVEAGAYVVLAQSGDAIENHGLSPDYVYSDFLLTNGGDEIVVSCDGALIDRVAYGSSWVVEGAASQLSLPAYDPEANDSSANWCEAVTAFGTDDLLGTPGGENLDCDNIDYCDPNPCTSAPAPECGDAEILLSYTTPGTCESIDGEAVCTYIPSETDCALDDYVCQDGYCVNPVDPCDPNPCSPAPAPECAADGVTLMSYTAPGTCEIIDEMVLCAWDHDDTDCSADGKACELGACVEVSGGVMPSVAGQLVFTEFMVKSESGGADMGEWLEIYNASGLTLDLHACVLKDDGTNAHTIGSELLVAPGEVLLLAASDVPADNQGIPAEDIDYVYGAFITMSNGTDEIVITCGGTQIDRVNYNSGWFTDFVATQLDPEAYDADANNVKDNWCGAKTSYGDADPLMLGTPGLPNVGCATPTVNWCRLQHPVDAEMDIKGALTIYGRVYVEGLTETSAAVDSDAMLVGQAGYGSDGSHPNNSAEWTWVDAVANDGWDANVAEEPNNDEYQAEISIDALGTFDTAFRFSYDGGVTWTLCDRDMGEGADGSEDGYQIENAGALVVNATACDPNPCDAPDAPSCEGDVLTTFAATGTCTVVAEQPSCAYAPSTANCADDSQICLDGACRPQGSGNMPDAAGQLVINEFMVRAHSGGDPGEWIELINLSDKLLDLGGCLLLDDDDDSHEIATNVVVAAGAFVLLGKNANPQENYGVTLDYAYGDAYILSNGVDEIILSCGGTVIDRVTYIEDSYDMGTSTQLDPERQDATANDDLGSWCLGTSGYGTEDPQLLGTPGLANASCGLVATPCAPNPCDAPPAASCDGEVLQRYAATGDCTVVEEQASCDYPPQTTNCAEQGKICDAETESCLFAGEGHSPESEGEVIVSEFMAHSVDGEDGGEWLELLNTSASALDLEGCTLSDGGDDLHAIAGMLLVAPGARVLLASSADTAASHGLAPDYVYGADLILNNDGDTIILACGELEIDRVIYASSWFELGRSAQLASDKLTAQQNDEAANWCLGRPFFGAEAFGLRGTPGAENHDCAPLAVAWCRFDHPLSLALDVDVEASYYGRVEVPWLTNLSDAVDAHGDLLAEAGYGPDGSAPDGNGDWLWTAATANGAWDAAVAEELGRDEYLASFAVSTPGSYDLAFRFSMDQGATWTYCDGPAGFGADGSEDGYAPADAGALIVNATVCAPNPCQSVPALACDGDTLTVWSGPGLCADVASEASCSYPSVVTDCGLDSKLCNADLGRCAVAGEENRPDLAGEVLVTEFMAKSQSGQDPGEWIELYNAGAEILDLGGCLLGDDSETSHEIEGVLTVAPGAYLVLAKDGDSALNHGLVPDYIYANFLLGNSSDAIVLRCDGLTIDRVAYTSAWIEAGASTQLDPGAYEASANDDGAAWCSSFTVFGSAEPQKQGTPGQANEACNPCLPNPCTQPPLAECAADGFVLTTYAENGLCSAPEHVVICDYPSSEADCAAGLQICEGGACVDSGDPCVPNPCVAAPAPACEDATTLRTFTGPGTCSVPSAEAECDYAYMDTNCADEGKVCSGNLCIVEGTGNTPDEAGELIITEFMARSQAGDDFGEWIEIYNATGAHLDLNACELKDDGGDSYVFNEALVIAPGATLLLAASGDVVLNHGLSPNHVYTGMSLTNGDDEIIIHCGSVEIDRVAYGTGWFATSVAMQLDPDHYDVTANGDIENWCAATTTYGTDGMFGTPGAANAECFDPCEPNPCVAVPSPVCDADGHSLLTYSGPAPCTNDDGGPLCGAYPSASSDCSLDGGKVCVAGACVTPPAPTPSVAGQVVITEFMARSQPGDDQGEWVELYNPGAATLEIEGCVLHDDDSETHTILGSLVIESTSYLLLARSGDAGENHGLIAVDYVYSDFFLSNLGDEIVLTCGATVIDRVAYEGSALTEGAATQLAPELLNAVDNDLAESWCAALGTYGTADPLKLGSPGGVNESCVVVDPCDPNPCGEPPADLCDDADTRRAYEASASCTNDAGEPVCGDYGFVLVDCGIDEVCANGVCVAGAGQPSAAGDLVFTEFMAKSQSYEDPGEWLELYNPGDLDYDLLACAFVDNNGAFTIAESLVIEAGGYLVFGRSADTSLNHGLVPDYVIAGLSLSNAGEAFSLRCAEVDIDGVTYDDSWVESGAAIQLNLETSNAAANDLFTNWCLAETGYGSAEPQKLGSPGAQNIACAMANPCAPNPCDTPPAAACDVDGVTLISYTGTATCTDVEGVASCGEDYASSTTNCVASMGAGATCVDGACLPEATNQPSAAGDLVFTELMPKSQANADPGEWLELVNTTAGALDLAGCEITDNGGTHVIATSLPVAAGGYLVFAASGDALENHGLPQIDYVYTTNGYKNSGETISLSCSSTAIDAVTYTSAWVTEAVAIQLDPGAYSASANDSLANWCNASAAYGTAGKLGTPGSANAACE